MRISDWSSYVCYADLMCLAQYRVTEVSHSSRIIAFFLRGDSQPIRRSFFGEKSLPEACIALLFWVFRTGPPRSSWAGISSTLPGTAGKSSTQIGRKIGAICRSAQETRRMVDLAASRHFSMEASSSEEHTSELQSLMRNSYAIFCLQKKTT